MASVLPFDSVYVPTRIASRSTCWIIRRLKVADWSWMMRINA